METNANISTILSEFESAIKAEMRQLDSLIQECDMSQTGVIIGTKSGLEKAFEIFQIIAGNNLKSK